MSQEINLSSPQNLRLSEGEIGPPETVLLEIEANHLMDELFQELDPDLEPAPTPDSAAATTAALASVPPTAMGVASLISSSEELLVPFTPLERGLVPASGPTTLAQPTVASGSWLQQPEPSFLSDRLLFGIACASLVLAVLFWLANQLRPQPLAAPSVVATNPSPVSAADRQFANYLQRSLDRVSRKKAPAQASPTATQPKVNLPPVGRPETPAVPPALVAQRIYIPVYQPPPPQVQPLPTIAAAVPTQPQPPQAGTRSHPAAPTPPPVVAAKPKQTLVGVLELGDRSMALIEAEGTTRRINLGETLDASGWKLTQIVDQKAVLERQGQVRAIYVGETF